MVLVIIDGLDSSGKSTQALRLRDFLTKQGKTVFLRFHPSMDNFFGVRAKQLLYSRGRSAHFAVSIFYMLDVIRSILLYSWRNYDYVVFTRYLMGTAYLPPPLHRIAYSFFALVVPTSDHMLFLDVSPNEAQKRIEKTRCRKEIFENIEQLERTRSKALSLAAIGKWTIIDANKPVREVEKQIRTQILL